MDPLIDFGKSKFTRIQETLTNEGMKSSGVEEDSIIKQLGIFILALIMIILGIFVYLCLASIKSQNPVILKTREMIKNKLFFSSMYRYLIVSNLKLTYTLLGFCVAFWSFNSAQQGTASIGYLLGICGLIIWPLFIMVFLYRRIDELEKLDFKKKHE